MILHVGLVFLFLTCARTTEDVYNSADSEVDNVYNNWPSSRYAARLLHFRKREADLTPKKDSDNNENKAPLTNTDTNIQHGDLPSSLPHSDGPNKETQGNNKEEGLKDGLSEGAIGKLNVNPLPVASVQPDTKVQNSSNVTDVSKGNVTKLNETQVLAKTNSSITNTTVSATASEAESSLTPDSPGVVKRGLIVFGGFSLLAVAYFIFYRKKNKKYDSGNTHNTNDANQFRYGVLQSDDRRDNLELSRIPLTMESDEDEDEDLEIFDLEQKKKSLSYVNLQTNDEDIVLHSSKDESKNNLLLDIEDGPSDTLINWSSTSSKSIL